MYLLKLTPNLFPYFWAILLCLSGHIAAQGQTASEYDIKWVQLPDQSANRNINNVFQDRYGTLWVGCQMGLFRYDGLNVERHSLYRNDTCFNQGIRSISEDEDGNLWLGAGTGLKILTPMRDRLLPMSAFGIPDSFATVPVSVSKGPGNCFYLLSGKHIFEYRAGRTTLKWTLPCSASYVILFHYNILDGCLYICVLDIISQKMFVIEPDGKLIMEPAFYNQEHKTVKISMIYTSIYSKSDSFSFVTENGISLYYNVKNHEFQCSPVNTLQINASYQIGSVYNYLSKTKNINTDGFVIHQTCQLSNNISAFISTEGLFLMQTRKNIFNIIEASKGKRIRGIQSDYLGRLIYSSYYDIWWQYPNEPNAHLVKKGGSWYFYPINDQKTMFLGEEELGGHKYWYYLRASEFEVSVDREINITASQSDLIMSYSLLCMAPDTLRHGIWHYLHGWDYFQIIYYDQQKDQHYFLNRFPQTLQEPRGIVAGRDLWLGGFTGLKRFVNPDPQSGRLIEDNSGIPAAIRNLHILCLYSDAAGALWFGVESRGLYRYKPETSQYEQFTTAEGLPDNSVFSIIGEPGDSVLWLGTGKGLSRVNVAQRRFENYYQEDGLAGNEFNTAAAYRAPDGAIYMGGQNGITRFYPDNFKSHPPSLRQTAYLSLVGAGGNDEVRTYILRDGDLREVSPAGQTHQKSL